MHLSAVSVIGNPHSQLEKLFMFFHDICAIFLVFATKYSFRFFRYSYLGLLELISTSIFYNILQNFYFLSLSLTIHNCHLKIEFRPFSPRNLISAKIVFVLIFSPLLQCIIIFLQKKKENETENIRCSPFLSPSLSMFSPFTNATWCSCKLLYFSPIFHGKQTEVCLRPKMVELIMFEDLHLSISILKEILIKYWGRGGEETRMGEVDIEFQ